MLRNRRLVNEASARSKNARDLAEGRGGTRAPAADVIAGSEIDHEIEFAVVEGQRARVGFDHSCAHTGPLDALAREHDERRIDVDAGQRRRTQPRRQHGQCDTAATTDLQDALAPGRPQRGKEQRNFEPFLQAIPRFYIAEWPITVRVGSNMDDGTTWC